MPKIIIGVMGPGESATAELQATAYELGQHIAQQGWILLTGGRNLGVMDAACRGAKSVDGLTIGILPSNSQAAMSTAVDIPIVTGLGHARNVVNVLSSRVVVACGLGAGTISEVAIALKIHRPVILLQVPPDDCAFFQRLNQSLVYIAADCPHAIRLIHHLTAAALSDPQDGIRNNS